MTQKYKTVKKYEVCSLNSSGNLITGIENFYGERALNYPYDSEKEAIEDIEKHFQNDPCKFFILPVVSREMDLDWFVLHDFKIIK